MVDLCAHASARVMTGELLEREGRQTEAIAWATAELQVGVAVASACSDACLHRNAQEPVNKNLVSKTRAGRLLVSDSHTPAPTNF